MGRMSEDLTGGYRSIDPREFIDPPYIPCPRCDGQEFGVLTIEDHHYSRRCKSCWHTVRYKLPSISKKLIYLDQFAISNLLFADERASNQYNLTKTVDGFWQEMLTELRMLLWLQLVVCPMSSAHDDESSLARFREPLRRANIAFSEGVSFHDFHTIKRWQLVERCRTWLGGVTDGRAELVARDVLNQDPDVWTEKYQIMVNYHDLPGYLEELEHTRSEVANGISSVFQTWKASPEVSWEKRFDQEALSFGPAVLKQWEDHFSEGIAIDLGLLERRPDRMFAPHQALLANLVRELNARGVSDDKLWPRINDFMRSETLKSVPFIKISAALWASLARKAAHQDKLPTKGFSTDVETISCLLPFCDAMFLDVECWNYLRELKTSGRLSYAAQVFSVRTKDEFLSYLSQIRESASSAHVRQVHELYGVQGS